MLNKLRCHSHIYFSTNQITWSKLFIQIQIFNDKQYRSRSVGFFRSQLIWINTVCKGRVCPGSAGHGLSIEIYIYFQIAYPPVQQRPAWTQPLALLTDDAVFTATSTVTQAPPGLPYIKTPTLTIPSAYWQPVAHGPTASIPHPPLRSRPLSAGSRRAPTYDR